MFTWDDGDLNPEQEAAIREPGSAPSCSNLGSRSSRMRGCPAADSSPISPAPPPTRSPRSPRLRCSPARPAPRPSDEAHDRGQPDHHRHHRGCGRVDAAAGAGGIRASRSRAAAHAAPGACRDRGDRRLPRDADPADDPRVGPWPGRPVLRHSSGHAGESIRSQRRSHHRSWSRVARAPADARRGARDRFARALHRGYRGGRGAALLRAHRRVHVPNPPA